MLSEIPTSLVHSTAAGDHASALALFDLYTPFVLRQCARFGLYPAFDRDDARQTTFVSMLLAATEAADTGKDFTLAFETRSVNDLQEEVSRLRGRVALQLSIFNRAFAAAKLHDFDLPAARTYLATQAPAWQRMTPATFNAIWAGAFGIQIEWDSVTPAGLTYSETTPDTSASRAFAHIEDTDAVSRFLSSLPPIEREVIERLYGLAEFERQEFAVVGTAMGMHRVSISRIHSRILAKLMMSSDLPPHYTPTERTAPRLRSTSPTIAPRPAHGPFPVTISHKEDTHQWAPKTPAPRAAVPAQSQPAATSADAPSNGTAQTVAEMATSE